ncbi:hypothetical protein ACIQUM_36510 [Amycolatopsis azurea]|uniref:hypothetical protein n=1 Tax=Amycolatopsis azurea TaxID=36819 RepID=UPI003811D792
MESSMDDRPWRQERAKFYDDPNLDRLRDASAQGAMVSLVIDHLNGLDEAARVGPVSRAEALFMADNNLAMWVTAQKDAIRAAAHVGEPLEQLVQLSGLDPLEVQKIIDDGHV